ncbi:hypothetical protein VHEMI03142 [[Torrubiella] hemipterigena]|uniref:Uncharacterized protein n=1 Tax=[Torrubiella] hemipterigena TaxID=1531966 RepID=A0A0A1TAA6_9HYPO|nr:hypothetical protein VHEMI03142 [[Torrubiella] hemipterigena]
MALPQSDADTSRNALLASPPLSAGIPRKPVPSPLLFKHGGKEYTSVQVSSALDDVDLDGSSSGNDERRQKQQQPLGIVPTAVVYRGIGASLRIWKWELISLLVSYLSFMSIIAVLAAFQGKLLSSWSGLISINAIIAILATIFKAALVLPVTEGISQLKWLWLFQEQRSLVDVDRYDQASRGAWGSILLIARQFSEKKKSYLASLGAFIFLLTLITDPFYQAAVQVNTCYHNSTALASVPRVNHYTATQGAVHDRAFHATADMDIAVTQGMVLPPRSGSDSIAPSVLCSTGNCTFGDNEGVSFSTLDMCHVCENLTTQILTRNITYEATTTSDASSSNSSSSSATNGPSGRKLKVRQSDTTSNSSPPTSWTEPTWILESAGGNITMLASGGPVLKVISLNDNTTSYPIGPWTRSSILEFRALAALEKKNCTGPQDCSSTPFAFQCSLRPCAKTFKASMKDGKYKETEVSREYMHRSMTYAYEIALNRTIVNGTWVNCSPSDNETETNSYQYALPEPPDIQLQPIGPHPPVQPNASVWYPRHCVYAIETAASVGLEALLRFSFDNNNITRVGPLVLPTNSWVANLWADGNISMATVNNFTSGLATTLAVQMRRTMDKNIDVSRQLGQTIQRDTCINIRWHYLSFGAIVLVLETAFLVAVIFTSHRRQWNANWKSSFLGLLVPQAGPDATQLRRQSISGHDAEDKGKLRRVAKDINVSLAKVGGRWQLHTVEKLD